MITSLPGIQVVIAALYNKLLILLVLMLFNVLFGVIMALVKKRFQWDYLTNYLQSDLLPILGWLAYGYICLIPVGSESIPTGVLTVTESAVYLTVLLRIMSSLLTHFAEIGIMTDTLKAIGISPPKIE
jgi:hypothetical protein